MLFLKQLKLVNYCAYENHTFDFTKADGTPYQYVCFFGPNGIGKSSILEAISMLTMNNAGRGESFVKQSLQKYIHDPDYDPMWQSFKDKKFWSKEKKRLDMLIEGAYIMDGKEYVVQLTQDGYARNDFAPISLEEDDGLEFARSGPWGDDHLAYRQRLAHFIKSDSDLSLHRVQIHISQVKKFEKIISEITRYPVECLESLGMTAQEKSFCTDFLIKKTKRKTGKQYRIHFKRMSVGEKKIAKSFSELLNLMRALEYPTPGQPSMPGWPRILLIDNIVMHIYFDRHITMIKSLMEVFNKQQIFATTHSGVLIPRFLNNEHDANKELMIDLDEING